MRITSNRGQILTILTSWRGGNPLKAFADILSFGVINGEVEGGKTEFPVNRESLDDNGKQLFDNTVSHFCALAGIMKKKEEKKEE